MPLNDDFVKEDRYQFIHDEVLRLEFKYSMPIDVSGSIPETINSKGWIYILSNPCMPGLLKIGMTTISPQARAKELSSSTGVPEKFTIEASYFSDDPRGDEARIHAAMSEHRLNDSREFFTCSLDIADEICRSYYLCDSKSSLEEIANDYSIICTDKPIKLDLHEWFQEFNIPVVGSMTNALKAIFMLGSERLDEMGHDGISIIIENGEVRGIMSESHQSGIAYLEEIHERETITGIYGPRMPGGF
ncbi:GIY-YIG nuclease family protein [Lelliottia amnigena]|uniref:GIY-YIG nuclease family protein n=1 Tax=Lelliottia amnigena TaxID=61646 RepID=UPI003BA27417